MLIVIVYVFTHLSTILLIIRHLLNILINFVFDTYDVYDVLNNDLLALLSRIYFIQDREPCSMFLGL